MATPLIFRPLLHGFVVVPWWIRRCPRIVVGNNPRSHVSCMQNPWMPRSIIVLMVFSNFSPPIKPWTFWFRKNHAWGQVSRGLVFTLNATPCGDQPWGSRLRDLLSQSWGGLRWVVMVWTMAPVGSVGFLSREGEGMEGADLLRIQRGLVFQASEAGRLSWVGGAPITTNSTPRQWRQWRGQLAGSSSGIYVVKLIAPY